MRVTYERIPHVAIGLALQLPRDRENAKRLLTTIESDGYPLREINYDGQIAITTTGFVLEQPN